MQKHQTTGLQYFPALNLFLGICAILLLLLVRKESANTLFGYSPDRLIIITAEAVALILFVGISREALKKENTATRFSEWLAGLPLSNNIVPAIVIFCLAGSVGFLWIAIAGHWNQLGSLGIFIQRALPFLLWPGTLRLQLFFYDHLNRRSGWDKNTVFSLLVTSFFIIFLLLDALLRTRGFGMKRLQVLALNQILPDFAWTMILAVFLFIWHKISKKNQSNSYVFIRNGLTVFLAAIFLYTISAMMIGQYGTSEQAYSPDLAAALLRGQAYLDNPVSTLDLTYANGHWYVPYPPLVALLMIPQVALFGAANMNTVNFSILFASLNTALVFMILEKLRSLGWTKASLRANVWLTILFSIGTVHWYIALWGEVWPLNQLTAVSFVGLATLITLFRGPAWLAGTTLGLAMLARPHVGLTYPFLLGIHYQLLHPLNFSSDWKKLFKWLLSSGVALSAVIGMGIFWYNALRFGSPLDFGYNASQINVSLFNDDLHQYGQFNIHFVLRNLQVMLFGLPTWNPRCNFFSPSEAGMSVLITTPALLYLVRARKLNPVTLGAWTTVGLFLIVFLLHYSTGAVQFGYRFLLDLIIPIVVLLGLSMPNEGISFPQKILIMSGVLVNYWGLWWFFWHWCR